MGFFGGHNLLSDYNYIKFGLVSKTPRKTKTTQAYKWNSLYQNFTASVKTMYYIIPLQLTDAEGPLTFRSSLQKTQLYHSAQTISLEKAILYWSTLTDKQGAWNPIAGLEKDLTSKSR